MIKFLPILLVFLSSCKTTRQVDKEVIKDDSAVIKENVALRRFLSEEIERFEKDREAWENTGVVFNSDCPDSIATKIIFDNGKIKSIEGRVKSLNQNLHEKSSELLDAHRTVDSLQYELEKEQTNIKKEVTTIHKYTKTKVMPGWIWLLLLVGWIARGYWPIIKKYLLPIKL